MPPNSNNKRRRRPKIPYLLYKWDISEELMKDIKLLQKQCDYDMRLVSGDEICINFHQFVLTTASPYFDCYRFFKEGKNSQLFLKDFDSLTLKLIKKFMYTGRIKIDEHNALDLLVVSNYLQIEGLKENCCKFLNNHINPRNCLSIWGLSDFLNCEVPSAELYVKQHFSEAVNDEILTSLLFTQLLKLIQSDILTIRSEEEVYECVVRWVKHDPIYRKIQFPALLNYVRLPILSLSYLQETVANEQLLKNSACSPLLKEALLLQEHKFDRPRSININRTSFKLMPRKPVGVHKVILVFGGSLDGENINISIGMYYDPMVRRKYQIDIDFRSRRLRSAVFKDEYVFALESPLNCPSKIAMLHFSLTTKTPIWIPSSEMLVARSHYGVAILNNCIYIVGGLEHYTTNCLDSAEVFNCNTQEWTIISSMSSVRYIPGIGVLNNLIYVVGGENKDGCLKSVEYYNPDNDRWTSVADMHVVRSGVCVGVLNGLLYAIGGRDGSNTLRTVEVYNPQTGAWSFVAHMKICRFAAGVTELNGFLYVVGGNDGDASSIEMYNPHINEWEMVTSMECGRNFVGVLAIDKPNIYALPIS